METCEDGNEQSASIKCKELVDELSDRCAVNTLRTGSFKLLKRPFPGFLTILTH